MYAFTASAFKDITTNGVLLLYISADGYETHMKSKTDPSYDVGGVKMNHRRDDDDRATSPSVLPTHPNIPLGKKSVSTGVPIKYVHNIFPGDLFAFLRKPLFLIIDSNNSIVFQNLPNLFGQPLISLLSPVKSPPSFQSTFFDDSETNWHFLLRC